MHGQSAASDERAACLGLWAIPGLGTKALDRLRPGLGHGLGALLRVPISEWVPESGLRPAVQERLAAFPSLADLAARVQARAQAGRMQILYPGDAGFPPNLAGLPGAPPLIFFRGTPQPPRRRVAMVGSRHPDGGFLPFARKLAAEVAEAGVGIVSGAADGVDRACHLGCLDAGQETWAFVGSAIDVLEGAPAKLAQALLERGGSVYSELPPGVGASRETFPRRNRLISGASDAVLVLRAGEKSGSLYTALAALEQGRPLLALPGDVSNPAAAGANALIWAGKARLCRGAPDVWDAMGMAPGLVPSSGRSRDSAALSTDGLSAAARSAYAVLTRAPRPFDEVRGDCRLSSAALTSALCELELTGLVVQHPGKLYERI